MDIRASQNYRARWSALGGTQSEFSECRLVSRPFVDGAGWELHSVPGGEQFSLLASAVGLCPPSSIESRMCGKRYSGQWEMLAVSLWAVALYCDTDSGIPGFYRHAMLDFAYKTSEAVTKGVTDEEGAIRGRQRCLLCAFSLF